MSCKKRVQISESCDKMEVISSGKGDVMEGINGFDRIVMEFVQQHFHNIITDRLFPILTYLGEAGAVWILLALFFLFQKRYRRQGVLLLCAMGAGLLLGEILLKNIVCRERPFQAFPDFAPLLISPPSGFSFPSGHSCSSFAAATVLGCSRKKWGIPALILATLIAFSRMFLFVHWPTDILAGALLGVLCGLTVFLIARKFEKTSVSI